MRHHAAHFRQKVYMAAVLTLPAFLLFCSGPALAGAKAGVTACLELLIPTLFPFLAVSALCTQVLRTQKSIRPVRFLLRTLFFLPGEAWPVLLLSILGGYPVGAKTIAGLQKSGALTQAQSARLLLFCVQPGPAFVLTAVGRVLLGRPQAGAVLAAAVWGAGLLLGVLYGLFARLRAKKEVPPAVTFPAEDVFAPGFVDCIADAGKSLLLLCGTVIFFSVWSHVFPALLPGLPTAWQAVGLAALEITCGIQALCHSAVSLPVLAAALAFGGICVHTQVRACFGKDALPGGMLRFFAGRLAHAGLSFALCRVLLRLFPQAVPAFAGAGGTTLHVFSHSVPAAGALLLLVSLLLFSINLHKGSRISPAGVVE